MDLTSQNTTNLAPNLKICRIINGMWQVSGAHGYIEKEKAIKSMGIYVDKGFITWDLADHYGPAEDFVKIFRERRMTTKGIDSLEKVKFFTKWVPRPQNITQEVVQRAIDNSRKRMGLKSLDLLQFHWWDYQDRNYIKAIEYLDDLRKNRVISNLGLTNFDTIHVKEFISMGIKIVSNQVQYSLIDRRPEQKMAELCRLHDIKILAYGTLCGGLLSKKYLGQPEPFNEQLYTASLYKYKKMIDRWGGWKLFQSLLRKLDEIAKKYHVSIANVAVRYVLDNPIVGGAIIGTRLGISEHIEDNAKIFNFSLNQEDLDKINSIVTKSRNLMEVIGDCGDEYRS